MRRASIVVLLGASLLWLDAAAGKPQKTKGKTAKTAKAANAKNSPKSGKTQTRVVGTRLVRTKSGKMVRVAVHAPAGPSYQTHPDADRYTEIQKVLADRGFFKGEANGQWGDESGDALRRFQASVNLPDDGKINALTLTRLGLGPRHDGITASTVPLPGTTEPSVSGSTVGAAASAPSSQPPS